MKARTTCNIKAKICGAFLKTVYDSILVEY